MLAAKEEIVRLIDCFTDKAGKIGALARDFLTKAIGRRDLDRAKLERAWDTVRASIAIGDVFNFYGGDFSNSHAPVDRKYQCKPVAVSVSCSLNDTTNASNIALSQNPNIKSGMRTHLPIFGWWRRVRSISCRGKIRNHIFLQEISFPATTCPYTFVLFAYARNAALAR